MESRARCAGFSVMEIGNRKERLRDYASFPDQSPKRNPSFPQIAKRFKKQESGSEAKPDGWLMHDWVLLGNVGLR